MRQLIVAFNDGSIMTYNGVLEYKIPDENEHILMATLEGEGNPLMFIFPLASIKYAAYGEVNHETFHPEPT